MLSRNIERVLLAVGLTLCFAFLAVMAYREVGSRLAVRSFQAATGAGEAAPQSETATAEGLAKPDFSLWAGKRIAAYRESLMRQFTSPVAILRIPKLRVEVAVFDGTDEFVLNRGVGRIIGTAPVGDNGNTGIAGHRDGFFRVLKDIEVGDTVTLSSTAATTTYAVDQIEIVAPDDVRVLAPRANPSVTLVTCYPFYYSGDAPQRFIVHCSRREERPRRNTGLSRADQSKTNQHKENET
jgi:sortase A